LLGVHNSGPYFHDGSARTLEAVFSVAGGKTYQAETASRSGSVGTSSNINQNNGGGGHLNGHAEWNGSGTATFSSVDGGATSGTGAVELRYAINSVMTVTVAVNGATRTFTTTSGMNNPGWMAGPNWQFARIEGVNLNSGTANTITVTADSGFCLDDITVSAAGDLAKAEPHRRVLSVSATDRANLIAYLQQLDAKSAPTDPPAGLRNPENPANAVAGVNYDFHQFTAGLNDTNGLTAANKVSSGTWTSTLTALPGQELDSDDNNYGLGLYGLHQRPDGW
jgi:hypothetical protein